MLAFVCLFVVCCLLFVWLMFAVRWLPRVAGCLLFVVFVSVGLLFLV